MKVQKRKMKIERKLKYEGHEINNWSIISSVNPWHRYHKEADSFRASAMRSLTVSLSPTKFKADANKAIMLGVACAIDSEASAVGVMTGAMFAVVPLSVSSHNLRVRHSVVG